MSRLSALVAIATIVGAAGAQPSAAPPAAPCATPQPTPGEEERALATTATRQLAAAVQANPGRYRRFSEPARVIGGDEAKALFARNVFAIVPRENIDASVSAMQERGWTPTDRMAVFVWGELPDPRKARVTRTQSGVESGPEGLALYIWDWNSGNGSTAGAFQFVDNWRERMQFDGEVHVDTHSLIWMRPYWYSSWSYNGSMPIPMRGGDVERAQRPTIIQAQSGSYQQCQQERGRWQGCMMNCLSQKMRHAIWAGVGGAVGGGVTSCVRVAAGASGGGPGLSMAAYATCVGAYGVAGLGLGLAHQFIWSDNCDASSRCGAAPPRCA
jgi:hypothetical protein